MRVRPELRCEAGSKGAGVARDRDFDLLGWMLGAVGSASPIARLSFPSTLPFSAKAIATSVAPLFVLDAHFLDAVGNTTIRQFDGRAILPVAIFQFAVCSTLNGRHALRISQRCLPVRRTSMGLCIRV